MDAKDAANREARQQLKEAAKAELAQFYETRSTTTEGRKSTNRESEAAFVQALEVALHSDNSFARIGELIDSNIDPAKNEKDISRFRQIIIQWKSDPPQHIGQA